LSPAASDPLVRPAAAGAVLTRRTAECDLPAKGSIHSKGGINFDRLELAISEIQGLGGTRIVMNAIFVLLAGSVILGLVLGLRFSWIAILVSGFVLAIISATVLQKAGFDYLEGIAIIVACLTVNQLAYLVGVSLRGPRDQ
jgi:hypothetical protein